MTMTKREIQKRYIDKKRYGEGNRLKVFIRDNYTCQHCRMSNEEHKMLYNRELTIDHKDGNGRYSKTKNNDLDNLITLCFSCHTTKDNLKRNEKKRERIYRLIKKYKPNIDLNDKKAVTKEWFRQRQIFYRTGVRLR